MSRGGSKTAGKIKMFSPKAVFALPVANRYLFYAPLHKLTAVLDARALSALKNKFTDPGFDAGAQLNQIADLLTGPGGELAQIRQGPLSRPLFLGLITTRGCNMGCVYCDFAAPKFGQKTMDLSLARNCVDAYLQLVVSAGINHAEIQFFGGEPFFDNKVCELVVPYAREAGNKKGIQVSFEVTTNGLINSKRAAWMANNFERVVLSLDGPAVFQNAQRPVHKEKGSFDVVYRTAEILSRGPTDLFLRVCATTDSTPRLPAIARWMAENLCMSTVCFEALTPSSLSESNGFHPPDPIDFAMNVLEAEDILVEYGIDTQTSGTDIAKLQASFCPLGKDAMIVNPKGELNACYLLEEDWIKEELNLCFGRLSNTQPGIPAFEIEIQALEKIRSYAGTQGTLCRNCFCQYHCAGGCHVNHKNIVMASTYDDVCIQTRAVTIGKLLKTIGAMSIYHEWRQSRPSITESTSQANDKFL
jgi:uncharacterized protein